MEPSDTVQDKTLKHKKTRQIIKLYMLHVRQALLLKMALKFSFKLTERLYLSNGSRDGVVSSSTVYSEAPLILSLLVSKC